MQEHSQLRVEQELAQIVLQGQYHHLARHLARLVQQGLTPQQAGQVVSLAVEENSNLHLELENAQSVRQDHRHQPLHHRARFVQPGLTPLRPGRLVKLALEANSLHRLD